MTFSHTTARLFTAGSLFLSSTFVFGCLQPRELRPVAVDNAQNAADLKANVAILLDLYQTALEQATLTQLYLQINRTQKVVLPFVQIAEEDRSDALDDETSALKIDAAAWPDAMKTQMAASHPIVGDLVLERFDRAHALHLIDRGVALAKAREQNQLSDDAYIAALRDAFADVEAVGGFDRGRTALLEAFAAYRKTLTAQTELLEKHAAVVGRYAEGNEEIARALLGTAKDPSFQGDVLSLIRDADDRERAAGVFKLIGSLAKRIEPES